MTVSVSRQALGNLGVTVIRGIAPSEKGNNGDTVLVPSGAVFPSGIDFSKTKRFFSSNAGLEEKYLRQGDVLFNTGGVGTLGRSAFFESSPTQLPAVPDSFVLALRSHNTDVLNKYVFYFFQTDEIAQKIRENTRGSTGITSIRPDSVLQFVIPVPSLAVQQQLVDRLDDALQNITTLTRNAEQNANNARAIFGQWLNRTFAKGSHEWSARRLGELCELLGGFAFKSVDAIAASNTQVVRMGNLYGNKLDLRRSPVYYPDSYAVTYSRYLLKEGDLIMSLTGTTGKEDFGYAVQMPECERNLLLNQRLVKFEITAESMVNRRYLLYYLRSRAFLDLLYPTAKGTRQANLSTVKMKSLPVPLCALRKQLSVADELDELSDWCERLTDVYERKRNAYAKLRQALLTASFER